MKTTATTLATLFVTAAFLTLATSAKADDTAPALSKGDEQGIRETVMEFENDPVNNCGDLR